MKLEDAIRFYDKNYKKLLLIPFIILGLSILQILTQTALTGDFVNKGISLKGGVTITVQTEQVLDLEQLETQLRNSFPANDITVRSFTRSGQFAGVVVESDIDVDDQEELDATIEAVERFTQSTEHSIEGIGSSLGESFFKEVALALLLAFVFMGIVVFITFRKIVPSLAVILAAFVDIVVTLAMVNVLGIKLSTAGVAAFLMLIGYSVDTNILLTTKVIKRRGGTVIDRVLKAMRTGLTMSATTIGALIVALVLTQSEVIGQIMTILLIGLIVDLMSTWLQNVGLLRLYLEKRHRPE
jgi:preprotein translocase subunit SecF